MVLLINNSQTSNLFTGGQVLMDQIINSNSPVNDIFKRLVRE